MMLIQLTFTNFTLSEDEMLDMVQPKGNVNTNTLTAALSPIAEFFRTNGRLPKFEPGVGITEEMKKPTTQ